MKKMKSCYRTAFCYTSSYGTLYTDDNHIYMFYDEPLVFVASDFLGNKYFVTLADVDDDDIRSYLIVRISNDMREKLETGKLDIYGAYMCNNQPVLLYRAEKNNSASTEKYYLKKEDIPNEYLAEPGVFVTVKKSKHKAERKNGYIQRKAIN